MLAISKACKQLPPIAYDALIPVTHLQKLQHPRYGKIVSRVTFYFFKGPLVKDKRNQDCILHKSQNTFIRARSGLRPVEYWIMTRTFPCIDITAAGLSAFLHICKKYLYGSVPLRLHRLRNEWSEKPLVRDPYAIGEFSYKEVKRMMYREMHDIACLTGRRGSRRFFASNAWTELFSEYEEFLNRLMQRTGLDSPDVFYMCDKELWKAQKVIKAWLESHGRHVHYGNIDEVYYDDPPLSDSEHRSLQDACGVYRRARSVCQQAKPRLARRQKNATLSALRRHRRLVSRVRAHEVQCPDAPSAEEGDGARLNTQVRFTRTPLTHARFTSICF